MNGPTKDCAVAQSQGKKVYKPPQLLEWGSITDLTQGPLQGTKDFPLKGGTRPA